MGSMLDGKYHIYKYLMPFVCHDFLGINGLGWVQNILF
jgi:hypothetical protein